MFRIHRTTEPFVRVVIRIRYLNKFHFRTATYATECQTVDFLIRLQWITGKFDTYIFQLTGTFAVKFIRSRIAIVCAGTSFNSRLVGPVYAGITTDNQTAPVTGYTFARFLVGSKDDRFVYSTFSDDLGTRLDNQGSRSLTRSNGNTFDNGTCLDSQRSTALDINETFQEVFVGSRNGTIGSNITFQRIFYHSRSIFRYGYGASCRLISTLRRCSNSRSTFSYTGYLTAIHGSHLFIGRTPCNCFICRILRSDSGRQCDCRTRFNCGCRRIYSNGRNGYSTLFFVIITTRYSSKHHGQCKHRGQTF